MRTLIIFQMEKKRLPVPSAQTNMSEAQLDEYCRRHLVNHNLMVSYLLALIHGQTKRQPLLAYSHLVILVVQAISLVRYLGVIEHYSLR